MAEATVVKPKRKIFTVKRVLLVLVIGSVGLFALVVALALFVVPPVVRGQIESQGSKILGVPVTVGAVKISYLSGSAEITDLSIANPEGFHHPELMKFKSAGAQVALTSLLTNTIGIKSVHLYDPLINLEVNEAGEQNLKKLLANVEENTALTPEEEAKKKEEEARRAEEGPTDTPGIFLSLLEVRNFRFNVRDAFGDTQVAENSIDLGNLKLVDVFVPPSGIRDANKVMTLTLNELVITSAEKFPNREFVKVDGVEVQLDLARMMLTMDDQMEIHLPLIKNTNTAVIAEFVSQENEEAGPQNIREFNYALQNAAVLDEPKKYPELDAEALGKEPEPKDQATILAAVQETIEAVAAIVTPSKKPEVVEEEEPLPIIEVDKIDVTGFSFAMLKAYDEKTNFYLHNADVDIQDITVPHQPGRDAKVLVVANAIDNESKVTVRANGEITSDSPDRKMTANIAIDNQALAGIWKLRDGRLTGKVDVNIANRRAIGTSEFKIRNFSIDSPNPAERAVQESIRLVGRDGVPPIQVPFNVAMESGDYAALGEGLLMSIIQGIGSNVGAVLSAVGSQVPVGELTEIGGAAAGQLQEGAGAAASTVQEGVGAAAGAVGSGAREAEGAARDAVGRVGGLFGRRRSNDEPTPTPVEEVEEEKVEVTE